MLLFFPQDGFTALAIAAKEGYTEIAQALIAKGAYVNLTDRVSGSTIYSHNIYSIALHPNNTIAPLQRGKIQPTPSLKTHVCCGWQPVMILVDEQSMT